MRQALRPLAVVGLCGLFAWSCSPRQGEIMLDTKATPLSMLRELVVNRSEKLHSLEGSGAISFDSPELSGTAAFSSRLRMPDSLLVFLEGPFGIDVGTLFLSRDRYVVYNSMENRVFTGNPSTSSFRSVIPFELSYEQLLHAFAGIFTLPDGEPDIYEVRDGSFFLSFLCDGLTCEYQIDPDLLMVTEYRRRDTAGTLLLEARCTSLTEDGEAAAPRKIVVKFPRDQRRVSIAYSRLALNVSDISFEFSIPKNAQTIVR